MAHAFLRYAPVGDLRPNPLDGAVVAQAVEARLDEVMAWLKPFQPSISRDQVSFALAASIKRGATDGFRSSVFLSSDFGWPVDMELCGFVRDCCNALAFSLRIATRAWVVRTGLRFPARDNEKIEWFANDQQRAGRVISIDPSYAAAIVQPYHGPTLMDTPLRVLAEEVVANVTRGEYAAASFGAP